MPDGGADDLLLAAATAKDASRAQRRAFDHSLRLGRGFARTYGVELGLEELPQTLGMLDVPCLQGCWRAIDDDRALLLERDECPAARLGPNACDFFREASSGLVLGLTGGIRHARLESRGHGDARCIDLFHEDPESPLRFGTIPAAMRGDLARVRALARAFDSSAEVEFLGVSEGVLLYRLDRRTGASDVSVRGLVERAVSRRFPELSVREISPRPVLAHEA